MKIIRRCLAAVLMLIFVFVFSGVSALSNYSADLTLSDSVVSKKKIYVYSGNDIEISLNLKTDSKTYPGPMSAPIFYSNTFFSPSSVSFNKNGKFYKCCKTLSDITPSSKIVPDAKSRIIPSAWADAKKSLYDFYFVNAVPGIGDCTATPNSLDESVVNFSFKVVASGKGKTGTVFIPAETKRTSSNTTGATLVSCYTESGDILKNRYDFGSELNLNIEGAGLTYEITTVGDANKDGVISSTDALLILQFTTGLSNASDYSDYDVDLDKTVNSADALAVLQIATGNKNINDYINK